MGSVKRLYVLKALIATVMIASIAPRASAGDASGCALPGPPPHFTFDGVLPLTAALDTNGDGKDDYFEFFEKGRLVRIEYDRDFDGVVDGRCFCDFPMTRRNWTVEKVDGQYRLVPHCPVMLEWNVPFRAEKLDNGRWIGTFTVRQTRQEENLRITDVAEFKDGLLLLTEMSDSAGNLVRCQYQAGQLVRELQVTMRTMTAGRVKCTQTTTLLEKDTRLIEYDDDGDGLPEKRVFMHVIPDSWRKVEKYIDGRWTGDFEETERYTDVTITTRYQTGLEVGSTTTRGNQTTREFLKDGAWITERDLDGDGQVDFISTAPADPIAEAISKRRIRGQWTGDFQVTDPGFTVTYKAGKVVRQEWSDGRAYEFPSSDRTIESLKGKPVRWYFRNSSGEVIREQFDTNNDGQPNVTVDWTNLTIESHP